MHDHTLDGVGGNGAKAFQCSGCRHLITHSDRFIRITGANRHSFVNPTGVECDFYTFSACPGAVALGDRTAAYSWFVGYRWRMAFCDECGKHLGWHYESLSQSALPRDFWGILVTHIVTESNLPDNTTAIGSPLGKGRQTP
jgi:hypothetical protein